MRPIVRGAAAVLAAPALALSALVATSAPASAAVDPAPATSAGTWLASQLQDGLLQSNEFGGPSYGPSIDAALAFDAVGSPESVVDGISAALAAQISSYISGDAFGDTGSTYSGPTAKAAVLAQTAGDDPTSYGGVDLIERLESVVSTAGANAGRIGDVSTYGDYASPFGQVFAVEALDTAGSPLADSVTDFLLAQQCEAGFFRGTFAAVDAPDQTCDGGDGEPSVDATAQAVDALQSQLDDTDVAGQVGEAVDWLVAEQNADGSFGSDAEIPAGNANSTGLAGYALLISGETEAASHAAAWLRAHQATNVANCVYYDAADSGALLYDGTALTSAQDGPMESTLLDQTTYATAQALPGLLAAQAGDDDPRASFTAEYVKAGGKKPVGVGGAAPGEALCAMSGEQSVLGYADLDGDADLRVKIPGKTETTSVDVANAAGTFGTVEINALGKTKLKVGVAKQKAKKGKQQKVTVKGLAPAETVTVKLGKKKKSGQANGKGVFTAKLKVTGKPGKTTVKATGQFGNRTGKQTFNVTK